MISCDLWRDRLAPGRQRAQPPGRARRAAEGGHLGRGEPEQLHAQPLLGTGSARSLWRSVSIAAAFIL